MNKYSVLGYNPDLDPAAGQQIMQPSIAFPVQQRFNLRRRFVPAFLQCSLADMLRYHDIRRVQFTVANDLYLRDCCDLLAHQLEYGTAEVAGNTLIGLGLFQPHAEEGVVEALTAGREAVNFAHVFAVPFDFFRFFGPFVALLALLACETGDVPIGAFLARLV